MVRARRVKAEREATGWALVAGRFPVPAFPLVVIFTRHGKRAMDTDGLAASNKGCRDQVAQWLGVDDADPRIEWRYAQVVGKEYAVMIHLEQLKGMGNGY